MPQADPQGEGQCRLTGFRQQAWQVLSPVLKASQWSTRHSRRPVLSRVRSPRYPLRSRSL